MYDSILSLKYFNITELRASRTNFCANIATPSIYYSLGTWKLSAIIKSAHLISSQVANVDIYALLFK